MKQCENCKSDSHPVHGFREDGRAIMKGWYCPSCGHFEVSQGIEQGIPLEVKGVNRKTTTD